MSARRPLAPSDSAGSRPRNARPRGIRAIAVVAALAIGVGLAGCVPSFLRPTPETTSTPTGESPADPALAAFYGQQLVWESCDSGFQCTTATVPVDYADPAGDTLELALIRHPATGTRQGSLLVNPGGPGGSGYDFVRDSLDYAVSDALAAAYDVVGFDPRGVGRSAPISCHTTDAELDDVIYGILPGAVGDADWIAANAERSAAFAAQCAAVTGPELAFVGTPSAARDLDILRAALGDTTLHYLGYSYGTYLGATYAGLFPDKTGRLVLDGALDPALGEFDVTLGQAVGFDDAYRAYLADCVTRSDCPFRGSVDDAVARTVQLLAALQASPIAGEDGRQLGLATMFSAMILPLYSADTWSYLDTLLAEVQRGETATAFLLADTLNGRDADGGYADNSLEALIGINCSDYPNVSDDATMQTQAAQLIAAAPVFGPAMSYGGLTCRDWPYPPTEPRAAITAAGSAPILVVGTTGDPATAYAWSVALADELAEGHLVTYNGEGHTGYNKGNACVDGAVDAYLLAGTVPASDPNC